MGRKLFAVIVGIALVVVGFLYVKNSEPEVQKPQASSNIGVRVGKNSPVFTLTSLEGDKVTVGQPGKITVINFWATWCPPCQEEMPELDLFAKKNQQKINFYAINLQESNGKVSEFMNKSKYTMPVLLDKDGIVAKQFQVAAIPTTIIIDKNGIIKHRQSGAMTMNELDGVINSM
ncbi:TlpA disulfide reductase family protein [Pelosinus sp. IPA-1]|uniref:TlpA family protein disulfide reductase n=1 Tax=Pelosinus sp. IPA-1 TaxID=3029569 RepID=UPI0024362BCE|nr:TlpA disulfide reductase family protein [Pelosinus sp. IPA-1]GMB00775.1 thiol:disulfide interchange protein tlpA [Pelosinus sp. IPA-1]